MTGTSIELEIGGRKVRIAVTGHWTDLNDEVAQGIIDSCVGYISDVEPIEAELRSR